MSKRHGATSVGSYSEEGFLPEAFRNFLTLLGWSPGDDRERVDHPLDVRQRERRHPPGGVDRREAAEILHQVLDPEAGLGRRGQLVQPDLSAMLPKDENAYFSGLFYQNLAPMLKPLASRLTVEQMQSLEQIVATDPRPSVICAYGEQNRIEVASAGKLLPFDINSVAFSRLLGARKAGTLQAPNP